MALDYFHRTAAIDLADTKVAIGGGIHIAAQGGLWMMAVFGFAGLSLRSDGLAVAPHLPASWSSLSFSVQWRGRRLSVRVDQVNQQLEASLEVGEPMILIVGGRPYPLASEAPLILHLESPPP
jgi:trehalose/maltose hydrolase-like predicted phosphorylase